MPIIEKFNTSSKIDLTVLIAPLDWGLGHATRCIPIIKYLKSIGCEVIIAAGGLQLSLLKQEFTNLTFVQLAGYELTFSTKRWKTFFKILWQIPKILLTINRETVWLNNFLRNNKIDLVISDNRYGLYNDKTPSIFITHQLTIKTPFGKLVETWLRKMNYRFIQKFTECWVPDYAGSDNMGGELSHPVKMPSLPVKFIGRLSRIEEKQSSPKGLELLIILSGPEPQRSIFEKMLLAQLTGYHKPVVLIRGLPGQDNTLISAHKNLSIYNHLGTDKLATLMYNTTYIISRSGYSTVMDVIGLNKKCIFVPTPGQTEQEYLALYLSSRNLCLSISQHNFLLDKAIKAASDSRLVQFGQTASGQYQKIIMDFVTSLVQRKVDQPLL